MGSGNAGVFASLAMKKRRVRFPQGPPTLFNSQGELMKTIEKKCCGCENKFNAPLKEVKRGNGRFCSVSCGSKYRIRVKTGDIITCVMCGGHKYKTKSKIKSKSKLNFCSRRCKELAQRRKSSYYHLLSPHKNKEVMGVNTYRKDFMDSLTEIKCNRCEYNKLIEILEVHHKNRNRKDNHFKNLELLCPNCHKEEHFKKKDGWYSTSKK